MSAAGHPVTIAVTRPDGSIEQVRVGTAVRVGDSFQLTLGELTIGGTAEAAPPPRRTAPPPAADGGMVFPPYGRSKGAPIAGASQQDLEYYASGCRRTLADQGKARWHDKERQLLAAIEAEMARQGLGGGAGGSGASGASRGATRGGRDSAPPFADEPPPPPFGDDDIPPPPDDDVPF